MHALCEVSVKLRAPNAGACREGLWLTMEDWTATVQAVHLGECNQARHIILNACRNQIALMDT